MSENNETKNCTACKYYKQHYIKSTTCYRTVSCGHCTNSKITRRDRRKNFPYIFGCPFWEACETEPNDLKNIDNTISQMEKHLFDIKQMLSDELNKT